MQRVYGLDYYESHWSPSTCWWAWLFGLNEGPPHSISFFSDLFINFDFQNGCSVSARERERESFLISEWSFLQLRNCAYMWVSSSLHSEMFTYISFPMIFWLIDSVSESVLCSHCMRVPSSLNTAKKLLFKFVFSDFVICSVTYVMRICDWLQLISSAYQRCRLSEQICRLSVILTRSSSSHPSLRISSNPLPARAK